MLFDLRGRRKRVVQVIYVGLALLMGVGLVGLGIGGSANGGIFDALGLGGNGSQAANPDYQNQIDKANEALASNSDDQKALLTLARYQFLTAQSARETDDQGRQVLTDESISRYQGAIAAWQRYLATNPKMPNDDIASLMVQAYQSVIGTNQSLIGKQLGQLVTAGRIVADARPSVGTFTQLSAYAYFANETKTAEAAKKKALAQADDKAMETQIKQQLKQAEQQGKAIAAQVKAGAAGKEDLQNPTSGLNGGSTPLFPGASGTPSGTGAPPP